MFILRCLSLVTFIWPMLRLSQADDSRLSHHLSKYEALDYSLDHVRAAHDRVRRDTSSDKDISFEFEAYGRKFPLELELQQDGGDLYHPDHEFEFNGRPYSHVVDYMYSGRIAGEPASRVEGHIIGGVFGGVVASEDGETYFVERASRYFAPGNKPFHSVIYRDSDVTHPDHTHEHETGSGRSKRSAGDSFCGHSDTAIHDRVMRDQGSEMPTERKKRWSSEKEGEQFAWQVNEEEEDSSSRYTRETNERYKRQTSATNKTTVCTLLVESDKWLWKYFNEDIGLSSQDTQLEIVTTINDMVTATKIIYEKTTFSQSGRTYSGISFQIRRTKLNDTNECSGRFCWPNLDVNNFLNEHSYRNFDIYCLAYLFTYRDFSGGTLGLAWVGSPSTMSGGICEENKLFNENGRNIPKSLNSGIVTLLNHGKRVDIAISRLTLAHEIGHNFGSPHDTGSSCVPYSSNPSAGNFIMYASSTSGSRPNNKLFSPCSIGSMSAVLDLVQRGDRGKRNCFIASGEPFCGNQVVEGKETCDCGFPDECKETCCHPRRNSATNDCKLTAGSICSPSMGLCCKTSTCNFFTSAEKETCKQESECHMTSLCDGTNYTCPTPSPKPDTNLCEGYTKHCVSGACAASMCDLIKDPVTGESWEDCSPDHPDKDNSNFDLTELCYLGCGPKNSSRDKCETSKNAKNADFIALLARNNQSSGIIMPPGSPCDNFAGYCDVFSKCRQVDAEGPLTRLRKLLFSDGALGTVKEWVTKYWWAVLLMVLGLIGLMALFIKCCAIHTPSSNPQAPKALNFRETLRRPSQMVRGRQGAPDDRHREAYEYNQPQQQQQQHKGRGGGRGEYDRSRV